MTRKRHKIYYLAEDFEVRRQLRRTFQNDVNTFFKESIYISERTFRHLEISLEIMVTKTTERGELFLARSVKNYPALLVALDRIGIKKEMLNDSNLHPIEGYLKSRAHKTSLPALVESFYVEGNPKNSLVHSAKRIKDSRILRMEDMLIGPLEGRNTDWGLTRYITETLTKKVRATSEGKKFPDTHAIYDRIIDQLSLISEIDSSSSEQQFILHHDGERYRIQPFGLWGADKLAELPLPDGSEWIARGNVIEPLKRFSQESLAYLESLINMGAKENEFQRFFEKFPEYLLVLGGYARLHPQIILREDDGKKLISDFFLEKINSDFCDICDLKRPTEELVRYQNNRNRFRDVVMEAVAQLNYYRDWFEDKRHRNEFYTKYGLKAFRPNVVIIIGRRTNYYEDIERIRLESNLPHWIQLNTYDDVVDRARQWKKFVLEE
jgi:hypothetical protein